MIRLGTRGSALALAQAGWVAERLPGEVELVPIRTSGDQPSTTMRKGSDPVDKSRFVKEIEDALLRGEIDLAVHSAKDVPAELPDGLGIVGVPERADARDALCGAGSPDEPAEDAGSLAVLPEGAVVGTASLRRRAALLALRPDLEIRELRGNVDTRLRRLSEGDFDAIVLAQAGLDRLGRGSAGAPLPAEELVPAPGQGCLVLEARTSPTPAADGTAASGVEAAASLTDRDALACLTAERAVVHALEATCHTPIGAHAVTDGARLRLTAFVGLPDGSHWIRDELEGDAASPADLGRAVADRLLAAGAAALLADAERIAGAVP